MKMKKKGWTALLLAVIMLFAAACGGGSSGGESQTGGANQSGGSSEPAGAKSGEPVKVIFWHAMGGNNQKVVDQMVADFNKSQNEIVVEAIYQGSYDDLLSKLKATMGTKDGPSIVQVYEIGSRFMIDSKAIAPIQNFIDADQYDLSQLEPNITGYYTFEGKLYSMPFNTSNPILYLQ